MRRPLKIRTLWRGSNWVSGPFASGHGESEEPVGHPAIPLLRGIRGALHGSSVESMTSKGKRQSQERLEP